MVAVTTMERWVALGLRMAMAMAMTMAMPLVVVISQNRDDSVNEDGESRVVKPYLLSLQRNACKRTYFCVSDRDAKSLFIFTKSSSGFDPDGATGEPLRSCRLHIHGDADGDDTVTGKVGGDGDGDGLTLGANHAPNSDVLEASKPFCVQ